MCVGVLGGIRLAVFLPQQVTPGTNVLGCATDPIKSKTIKQDMPSVCCMKQTPFQTHVLQKLPCSPPFTSHSITLVVQSCLLPLCMSRHPCVLPKQGSYSS